VARAEGAARCSLTGQARAQECSPLCSEYNFLLPRSPPTISVSALPRFPPPLSSRLPFGLTSRHACACEGPLLALTHSSRVPGGCVHRASCAVRGSTGTHPLLACACVLHSLLCLKNCTRRNKNRNASLEPDPKWSNGSYVQVAFQKSMLWSCCGFHKFQPIFVQKLTKRANGSKTILKCLLYVP